ncbi:MAG: hypothetical protein ACR2N3_07395 [Pyrinomonadaceae bacterium]
MLNVELLLRQKIAEFQKGTGEEYKADSDVQLAKDAYEKQKQENALELSQFDRNREREQKSQNFQKDAKNAANYKSVNDNLDGEYEQLIRNGRELTTYEQTLRDLQTTYKDLSQEEKNNLLSKAAQIDATKQAQESYAKLRDIIGESVSAFADGGFKGLFDSIKNRFKQFLEEMITQWLTSEIFKVFSGQTHGGAIGGAASSAGGGFNLGNIFQSIFGGGAATTSSRPASGVFGSGAQGNGIYSFAGGGSNASSQIQNLTENLSSVINKERTATLEAGAVAGGNGILDQKTAETALNFSSGAGGKFSFGNLGKSLGSIAPMLGLGLGSSLGGGSMLGSLLGSVGGLGAGVALGIGTGAITASTPIIGGLIGALGGTLAATGILAAVAAPLLIGAWLLGRNKQRNADEVTRTTVINDALSQVTELVKQVGQDKTDGQSAIAQANSIRANYLTQVGALKDSKTRGIALKDVSRIDSQIVALQQAATAQDARKNIAEKWIPAYASGTYMDAGFAKQYGEFKRRNGILPGAWTGTDTLPSMLAAGEMVLNPAQIQIVRQNAGFDAFAGAGIPNYQPKIEPSVPRFADGVNFSPPSISSSSANNNRNDASLVISIDKVIVDAEGITFEGLKSNRNQRVIFAGVKNVIKKKG